MARDVISFDWPVDEAGYEWVLIDEDEISRWHEPPDTWPSDTPIGPYRKGNVLFEARSPDGPPYFLAPANRKSIRFISPIKENPNLCLEFASLNERPAEILAFANRWGLLGVPVGPRPLTVLERRSGDGPEMLFLEPVAEWLFAIRRLRFLLDIIARIRDGDEDHLSNHISWDLAERSITWRPDSSASSLSATESVAEPITTGVGKYELEHLSQLKPNEFKVATILFVSNFLNASLSSTLNVEARYDSQSKKPTLHLKPSSLLVAMYLQVASAFTDQAGYRECVVCNKWFEVSSSYAARSDKIYCSDACRMRAYRNRRKEANTKRDAQKEEG